MRVEQRGGDEFEINVRGHLVHVDQPVKDCGEDTVPTAGSGSSEVPSGV